MTTFYKISGRYIVGVTFLLILGCVPTSSEPQIEELSLPVVSGSRLSEFVNESELPVLVEFGVDFQCDRCRRMKTPIVDLADRFKGRAEVIRVDFNANAQKVAELGGTICPTYVFFVDGTPVQTKSFPVSADILDSQLESLIASSPNR